MILIFTSILYLLGGVDAQLKCARCNDFNGALLPSGAFIPQVELVVNNFIAEDGCKMANFKCVVLEKGHSTTAYISDPTTGERLVTYEPSQTESLGGNVTCVASSNSAGWRFNGVQAKFNCDIKWGSEAGMGSGDLTFPPEEPTTTTTTTTSTTTTTTVPPTTTPTTTSTTTKPTTTPTTTSTTTKPTTTPTTTTTTVQPTTTTPKDICHCDCDDSSYDEGNYHTGYY
ncbi:hypothetical protein B9Z55_021724 [Caenorhabditis nigoni]|uniref:C6 domain-containing protein n=1 Tax=Caenorhabditis nigoni TaxID=1611254 RepID=A0A2G5TTT2_9PELO|nr:hypothetical protein B9Z55_021724 [Caenorhabditis nigoni]